MSSYLVDDRDQRDELPDEVIAHGHGTRLHADDGTGSALCGVEPEREEAIRPVDPDDFRAFRSLCGYCFTQEAREAFEEGRQG